MRNGRSDAQDVIVFFTDGAANTMPNDSALETNRLPSMAPGIADRARSADRSRLVLEPPLQRRPRRRELGQVDDADLRHRLRRQRLERRQLR